MAGQLTAGQMVPNEATSPWLAPVASPGRLAPGSDPAVLPVGVPIADQHKTPQATPQRGY